ncbi:EamA family transporter [Streptomyces taklimakanensis]|uniref:EamA family transporter n=1 Tax=Streptomyces taklimakanensis TaxID=2569853 RepID=UPI0012BA5F9C
MNQSAHGVRPGTPARPGPGASRPDPRRAGAAFALGGIAFWSTNALAGSSALATLDLGIVLFLQFASGTLALGVVETVVRTRSRRRPPSAGSTPLRQTPTRGDWRTAIWVGTLGFGGTMTFQYVGFAYAPVVESNIIAYGWPMFAAVWLAVTVRNKSTAASLVFAFVGFTGVAMMTLVQGGHSASGSPLGYVSALLSALFMAFYTLGVGRTRVPARRVMIIGGTVACCSSLVIALATGADWTPTTAWWAMIYVGVGPCAAGYLLWSVGMTRSHGRLAPLGYATPLLSTCVLLLDGRTFGGTIAAAGAACVLLCTVGVLVVDGRSASSRL